MCVHVRIRHIEVCVCVCVHVYVKRAIILRYFGGANDAISHYASEVSAKEHTTPVCIGRCDWPLEVRVHTSFPSPFMCEM